MRKIWVGLSITTIAIFGFLVALSPGSLIPASLAAVDAGPALSIPLQIPAFQNSSVVVPVVFSANGNSISSVVFSIDYDQTWLTINPFDGNSDGTPDAVVIHSPSGFTGACNLNPADTDGELDCYILDLSVPLNALPSGTLVEITFQTGNPATATEAVVGFSATSSPTSFGSTTGQSVVGTTHNGSVLIGTLSPKKAFFPYIIKLPSPTASLTPTPTPTPTKTNMPQVTSTPTKTTIPTNTATPTKSPTRTATPTKTQVSCSNLIKNGGFEAVSDWEFPITEFSASYSTALAHSGTHSLRTGILNAADNRYSYSSARQQITIPFGATKARLTFYYYPSTTENPLLPVVFQPKELAGWYAPVAYDTQYVVVTNSNNVYLETIFAIRSNSRTWTSKIIDLLTYSGQTIKIEIGTYNDGIDGITSMYVDDVTFDYCP